MESDMTPRSVAKELSPFLVLDLGFDIVNSIRRFHLEGDGLSSKSLDKDLHAVARVRQCGNQLSFDNTIDYRKINTKEVGRSTYLIGLKSGLIETVFESCLCGRR